MESSLLTNDNDCVRMMSSDNETDNDPRKGCCTKGSGDSVDAETAKRFNESTGNIISFIVHIKER